MQFIVPEDCGNAPRKLIIQDLFLTIIERDTQTLLGFVVEDIIYKEIGKGKSEGIQALFERLDETVDKDIEKLELTQIITHGKQAAVNGKILTSVKQEIQFATFITFASAGKQAKVKGITSYLIEI